MGFKSEKKRIVRALIKRHGAACTYCGVELTEPGDGRQGPTDRTVDHVIPRVKGGSNAIRNLVLACSTCNNRKADRLPLEFVVWRAEARA